MDKQNGLKLFISYSHNDEKDIEEFIKHIAPLKRNGLIEDWEDLGSNHFDRLNTIASIFTR